MDYGKHARRGITKIAPENMLPLQGLPVAASTIAPGFAPRPDLNLVNLGGKTIPNLSFKSFYLDAGRWSATDMANIDRALSGAMADPHLNNVIKQYFPDEAEIETNFLGSETSNLAIGATFNRDSVDATLSALIRGGALDGINLDVTVVCLFLPPGAILTTDSAAGKASPGPDDDEDAETSILGLGGYHGSSRIGDQCVYFAVGVYSEVIGGRRNGIVAWPDPWKNVVATFYHELNEARTDPDVGLAPRGGGDGVLGWYSHAPLGRGQAGEIGDIPLALSGSGHNVMIEVSLVAGGTAPIQLMWSNAVGGPQGPFA